MEAHEDDFRGAEGWQAPGAAPQWSDSFRRSTTTAIVQATPSGKQRGFRADAVDARGRTVRLDGAAVAVAPLRQRRDGRLTLVNEGLTELAWSGREGLAISEWLVQTDA